jgi:hypothetical protein
VGNINIIGGQKSVQKRYEPLLIKNIAIKNQKCQIYCTFLIFTGKSKNLLAKNNKNNRFLVFFLLTFNFYSTPLNCQGSSNGISKLFSTFWYGLI